MGEKPELGADNFYNYIDSYTFAEMLKNRSTDEKYCFILGAGASVSSNIKAAQSCATDWINELKQLTGDEYSSEIKRRIAIIKEMMKQVPFTEDVYNAYVKCLDSFIDENKMPNVSEFSDDYFASYDLRYCKAEEEGRKYFLNLIQDKYPNSGYFVLAKMLINEAFPSDIVITTNFDNLMETAIRLSGVEPFVIGHESLAKYALRPISGKPTIMKIHRDAVFGGFNSKLNTSVLSPNWSTSLLQILKDYVPIVIGYTGTDNSLMQVIREHPFSKIYWCHMPEELPKESITSLLNKSRNKQFENESSNGYAVEISGFDDVIVLIHDALSPQEQIISSKNSDMLKYREGLACRSLAREAANSYFTESLRKLSLKENNYVTNTMDPEQTRSMFLATIANLFKSIHLYRLSVLLSCKAIKRELNRNVFYTKAIFNRGVVYDYRNDKPNAISDYQFVCDNYKSQETYKKRSLQSKQWSFLALHNLLLDLIITGEYEKAEDVAIKAMKSHRTDPSTLNICGKVFLVNRKYNEALICYENSVSIYELLIKNHTETNNRYPSKKNTKELLRDTEQLNYSKLQMKICYYLAGSIQEAKNVDVKPVRNPFLQKCSEDTQLRILNNQSLDETVVWNIIMYNTGATLTPFTHFLNSNAVN